MDQIRLCLIINNFSFGNKSLNTRHGSKSDVKRMQIAFYKCGFHIKFCNDPTLRELRNTFTKLSEENLYNVECIVVILMTHGESRDFAYAKDDKYNITNEIINSTVFQEFKKPKIVITQCCKAHHHKSQESYPGNINSTDFEEESKIVIQPRNKKVKNLFRFDSTFEGFLSERNNDGTKFVKRLFEEIRKYGFHHDIIQIADAVIKHFQQETTQTPVKEMDDFKGFILGKLTN